LAPAVEPGADPFDGLGLARHMGVVERGEAEQGQWAADAMRSADVGVPTVLDARV
jgi:hypothetical protein